MSQLHRPTRRLLQATICLPAALAGLTAAAAAADPPGSSKAESSAIRFSDTRAKAGIDFVHYAPRPRWCEIGPTVQGAATNEGLDLIFKEGR